MKRDRNEQTSEVTPKRKNISISQVGVCWYVCSIARVKTKTATRLNVSIIAAKSEGGWNKHTQERVFFRFRYASCVESLFPPLSFSLLCSDMFLSPSPKFPSFRERSEVRDSDLPRGWVKDSPPPSPPWEMCCSSISLFCIHLSLLSSLGSPDNVQKELSYLVSDDFRLFGWLYTCPAASCVESLCVWNWKTKTQHKALKHD